LEPRHKFSRTLGDTKMEIKGSSATISRYFGAENLTKEEANTIILNKTRRSATQSVNAGSWFDSITRSATLEGEYIYRPEAAEDQLETTKLSEKAVDSSERDSVLTDISNSPPPQKSLQSFQRKPSRNPFAVRKPIFKDSSSPKPEPGSENDPAAAGNGDDVTIKDGAEEPDTDDEPILVIDLEENDKTGGDRQQSQRISSPLKSLLERSKRQVPTPAIGINPFFKTSGAGSEVNGSSAEHFKEAGGASRLDVNPVESAVGPVESAVGPVGSAVGPVGSADTYESNVKPSNAATRPLGSGLTSAGLSRSAISTLKPGVRGSGLFKKPRKTDKSGTLKQTTLTTMFTKITKKAEI